LRTKGVRLSG